MKEYRGFIMRWPQRNESDVSPSGDDQPMVSVAIRETRASGWLFAVLYACLVLGITGCEDPKKNAQVQRVLPPHAVEDCSSDLLR